MSGGNAVGFTDDGKVFLLLNIKKDDEALQTMFQYTVEEAKLFADSLRAAAEEAEKRFRNVPVSQ